MSANDTFGTFSAAQIGSGWADLAEAGIPTYTWAINPAQAAGHPEIYGNREVDCISCTTRPSTYAIQAAGGKRIATLGYSASENSKDCADSTRRVRREVQQRHRRRQRGVHQRPSRLRPTERHRS